VRKGDDKNSKTDWLVAMGMNEAGIDSNSTRD